MFQALISIANDGLADLALVDRALVAAQKLSADAAIAKQLAEDQYAAALIGTSVVKALSARKRLDAAETECLKTDSLVRVLQGRRADALHVAPTGLRKTPWIGCFRERSF